MKTNTLENQDFLLGIQEEWDLYHEVAVKFIKEITTQGYGYHLFADAKGEMSYYLRPRYSGHDIEGIFVEKRIIVNIAKKDSGAKQDINRSPVFYATGILKLSK
jgi:hypothetical protein